VQVRGVQSSASNLHARIPGTPMSRRWMVDLPHDVYEVMDANDNVLYVGISMNTARRILQHRSKPWWPKAGCVRISKYPNLLIAKHVEGLRINEIDPPWNSQKERHAASQHLNESLTPIHESAVSF
jgi:hypothetical protein